MANKRKMISSFIGIPLVFWAAIFVFFILQTTYDLVVGDRNGIRTVLLILSVIGLILMIVFSFMKRTTVVKILKTQMGAD